MFEKDSKINKQKSFSMDDKMKLFIFYEISRHLGTVVYDTL